ncbi:MAG: CBS domain-containing protein, partial [Candidatus Theseobacter exili]|nr:CBS domain-containing protein [Candidatus Theseobacter exili]
VMVAFGTEETNVREFIIENREHFDIKEANQIPFDQINRLIIVDTRHAGRIGRFGAIAKSRKVEVHLYDHHPRTPDDIKGEIDIFKPWGSTTTIILNIIKKKINRFSNFDATLMILGIYEDTNRLTAVSTTPKDLEISRELLKSGASLSIAASWLNRELNSAQFSLFTKLLDGMESILVHGIHVFITYASSNTHVKDLSLLVHKLREVENTDVLFVLVSMDNRVHLIARSRLSAVDVSIIASIFGGGGHPSASSATIKAHTLIQVKDELKNVLHDHLSGRDTVKSIMNINPVTLKNSDSVKYAIELMKRYDMSEIPVLENKRFIGMLFERDIQKLSADLDEDICSTFVRDKIFSISSDTKISSIREKVMENPEAIPVLEKDHMEGIVTRKNILKLFHDDFFGEISPRHRIMEERRKPQSHEIVKKIKKNISPDVFALLEEIGDLGDKLNCNVYAVGGFVRDILLGRKNYDLDIVVEEHGIVFARKLARIKNGRCIEHKKFSTAIVTVKEVGKVDVATARTEHYGSPGALPIVTLATIRHDLFRRDFTINAMAVFLNKERFGELVDFFGGLRDLKDGTIRVLHNLSFVDDPTRIFRAVRFEQRFGFRIEKQTQTLIKRAVRMDIFGKVSFERIRDEVISMLKEPHPIKAISRMAEFNELKFIHPALKYTNKSEEYILCIEETLSWFRVSYPEEKINEWLVYFIGLVSDLKLNEVKDACERFVLRNKYIQEIINERQLWLMKLQILEISEEMKPSEVYANLKGITVEVMLYLMSYSKSKKAKRLIVQYLNRYRFVRLEICGDDLIDKGMKKGPQLGRMLRKIHNKKLDGSIHTKKEELELAKKMIKRIN